MTRKRILIGGALAIGLVVLWTLGTFDRPPSSIGLNAQEE
jgi:hypothetical protein